jgi:hypothetical protein
MVNLVEALDNLLVDDLYLGFNTSLFVVRVAIGRVIARGRVIYCAAHFFFLNYFSNLLNWFYFSEDFSRQELEKRGHRRRRKKKVPVSTTDELHLNCNN